ncbi:hypothetical protein DPMN_171800 [Dreissena polymorpha]|uniref:Uncharacterized protein n=1 Tax=Dreissena polymorpha TaxID=45954 RepID=A0A9D4DZT6_DREPO|nr:hypothetical protein DPMN_171800 [Dreissena polymorpha]
MIWETLHCTWLLSGNMSNEYNGFLNDELQGVALVSSTLLAMDKKQKPFTRRPCIATFKIRGFDCALVSVHLKATGLENEDIGRLQAGRSVHQMVSG